MQRKNFGHHVSSYWSSCRLYCHSASAEDLTIFIAACLFSSGCECSFVLNSSMRFNENRSSVCISGGGPSDGEYNHYIGGSLWQNPGAFANGFQGVCSVFVTAAFSFSQYFSRMNQPILIIYVHSSRNGTSWSCCIWNAKPKRYDARYVLRVWVFFYSLNRFCRCGQGYFLAYRKSSFSAEGGNALTWSFLDRHLCNLTHHHRPSRPLDWWAALRWYLSWWVFRLLIRSPIKSYRCLSAASPFVIALSNAKIPGLNRTEFYSLSFASLNGMSF